MKTKIKVLAVVLALMISILGGCEHFVTKGTVYNQDEWVRSSDSVYTYRLDNITKKWKLDYNASGDIETLKTADNYASWSLDLKNSFVSSKKRLDAISFVVTTDTDTTINFSFYAGDMAVKKAFRQQEIDFKAGEQTPVVFAVGEIIRDITTASVQAFFIDTFKYTPANEGEKGYSIIDGVVYNAEYTATEVNFTATDFQIIVSNVD